LTQYPTPLDARYAQNLQALSNQVKTLTTRTMGIDSGTPLMSLPGVIDAAYTGTGNPKVYVNGAAALSGPYPFLAPYVPTAGQAVTLQPVQTSYVILGPAAATSGAQYNMAAETATVSTVNAGTLNIGGHAIAPQPRSPVATNDSYDISIANSSYDISITNSSYPLSSGTDGIGAADGGFTSHPLYSGTAPTDHWHGITGTGAGHGHYYGNLAADFNALQESFSNMIIPLITAFNALRDSFSTMVGSSGGDLPPAFNQLRSDFSNLVSNYNTLLNALVNAGIIT